MSIMHLMDDFNGFIQPEKAQWNNFSISIIVRLHKKNETHPFKNTKITAIVM